MLTLFHFFGLMAAIAWSTTNNDPVVSFSGQLRMSEQLQHLKIGIEDAKNNVDACDKNAKTLAGELQKLNALEKEHLGILRQYNDYIARAQGENAKNETNLSELEKWEKNYKRAPATSQDSLRIKFDAAEKERADRAKWKQDAKAKVMRVEELKQAVNLRLKEIAVRRKDLVAQIDEWNIKKGKFNSSLDELTQKKGQLEAELTKVQARTKELETKATQKVGN